MWRRVVDRPTDLLGSVEASLSVTHGELSHEPTGIQLTLAASSATITIPYGASADDASRVLRLMYAVGAIIEEETGLVGYDPQVERPIKDAAKDPTPRPGVVDLVGRMLRRRAETERRAAQRRAEKMRDA